MLIKNVIDHYVEIGKKHPGNPFRLSNSGKCARALAYLRFPLTFKSEPMPARVFSHKGQVSRKQLAKITLLFYK